jgi:hypothetical protein
MAKELDAIRARWIVDRSSPSQRRAQTDIRALLKRIADLEAALDDILIALSDDNLNPDDDSGEYQMSMINEAHDIARKARGE